MRLEHLSVVHKAAHFLTGWRQSLAGPGANNNVKRFGSGQVMTYRADTAETLHENRGFPVRPALHKSFKSPEFHNMKTGLRNVVLVVEVDGNFSMSFHPGDGFYCDFL